MAKIAMHFILFFMLMILMGCQSLPTAPMPGVESPELAGQKGFALHAGMQSHYTAAAPGNTDSEYTLEHSLSRLSGFARGLYSPGPRWAFGLEGFLPNGLGGSAIAQYQILGSGAAETAEGNFSLMAYARLGGSFNSEWNGVDLSSDALREDPADEGCHDGRGHAVFSHGGLSAGYRLNKRLLIYLGGAMGHTWMRAKYDRYNWTSSRCETIKFSNYGRQATAGSGAVLRLGRLFQLQLGIDVIHRDFSDQKARTEPYGHVSMLLSK